MDDLNQPSGNPYARINNEDDEGQSQTARGGKESQDSSGPRANQSSRVGIKSIGDPALFDLEAYAAALRAKPSGNPCANSHWDDEDEEEDFQEELADESDDEKAPAGVSSRAWALPFTSKPNPRQWERTRYSDRQIEAVARDIQRKLWQQRAELFGDTHDPIQVLNPAKVLELYGYKVRYHEGGLGRDEQDGVTVDVAGLIDPAFKVVEVSMLPSPMERLFTLAHELGHVVLGSTGTVVHRDRPLNGTRKARDIHERAADKFAAYFLMPAKPVRQVFLDCYLTDCFELTEERAFALRASSLDVVQAEFPTLRALSFYLATAERYNGRVFRSLASIFNVSPVAMAIRLEELGLVK